MSMVGETSFGFFPHYSVKKNISKHAMTACLIAMSQHILHMCHRYADGKKIFICSLTLLSTIINQTKKVQTVFFPFFPGN
jgi:hypothetical protein